MTQIDVVFALRGIGVETGVSTLQRWEATGSIKLDDAHRLIVGVFGESIDDVMRRAIELAAPPASSGPVQRDPDDALLATEAAAEAARQQLVDRVRETTERARDLEQELERTRLERRAAMKAAADGGVTVYRIAQEAGTSHSSAWRIIHEYDEKWRATFEALDEAQDEA